MIETAATATSIAWYWWALGGYVVGAMGLLFFFGLINWDETVGIVHVVVFWPILLAVFLVAAPFAACWFIGNMLRRNK